MAKQWDYMDTFGQQVTMSLLDIPLNGLTQVSKAIDISRSDLMLEAIFQVV